MRKRTIVAIALPLGIAAFFLLAALATGAAKKLIEERRHDIAGLDLEIAGYELRWHTATLTLKGIKIYPAGAEGEPPLLASADRLDIRIALLAMLRGTLHAREVSLIDPVIAYDVTGKRTSNWDALHLDGKKAAGGNPGTPQKISLPLVVDAVRIRNGKVSYRNQLHGGHLDLTEVDIAIDDLRPPRAPGDLPTSFEMTAHIDGTAGTLSAKGRGDFLGEAINLELTGSMSPTPIGAFSSFYAGVVPYPIVAGSVSLSSRATVQENQLLSTHRVSIAGLRVGGGIKGDLINTFVLSQEGPLRVDASVGGDLSTGDFSVSAALTKNLVSAVMKRAAEAAPGMVIDKLRKLSPGKVLPIAPVERDLKNLFKGRR